LVFFITNAYYGSVKSIVSWKRSAKNDCGWLYGHAGIYNWITKYSGQKQWPHRPAIVVLEVGLGRSLNW
jgi:hypothetical protein